MAGGWGAGKGFSLQMDFTAQWPWKASRKICLSSAMPFIHLIYQQYIAEKPLRD
jgi:hypothetical protein